MRRSLNVFALVICCALLLAIYGCGSNAVTSGASGSKDGSQAQIVKKPLNDYTWSELAQISKLIASAPDSDAQRQMAKVYGIVEEDGSLTNQTKQIVLDGSRALDVRVAGIVHDDKADGSGKAGLTFMTVGGIELLPMNDEATVEGGWEASKLRSRLAGEQLDRLDKELADVIVPVKKMTNNVGITDSFESITSTNDKLWVFSVHEVCGDVTWDVDEFRERRGSEDVDGLLNQEGDQYEVFAQAGVHAESDPNGFLSLEKSTGKSPWWYRTPYPFEFSGYSNTGNNGYFYQVMDSGFPQSLGSPEVPATVIIGFCI